MAGERNNYVRFAYLLLIACTAPLQAEQIVQQGTNITADVSPADARLAIDLLGSIWVVPADGGRADLVSDNLVPARRPRWSPDGGRILYQTQSAGESQIWLIDLAREQSTKISDGRFFDRDPEWHPNGQRVVFSTARGSTGFDLWEIDLPTGLTWRLSSHRGDETEPVWSADGRHLAYIRKQDDQWSLVLRRHGQAEREIVVSTEPLSAPSWRPDGTLLTFIRQSGGDLRIEMAILSDPALIMPFADGEDFFVSPVSWLDKSRLYYTSDGVVKTRGFDDWQSTPVAFYATLGQSNARARERSNDQPLPLIDAPKTELVIRASRLFDGNGSGYRHDVDVLIAGPRIAELAARREWPDATVLELGDITVLPGFIDSYSSLSAEQQERHGAEILSYGVTTIITSDYQPSYEPTLWESEETPGPRLLWAGDIARTDDDVSYRLVTIPSAGVTDHDRRSAVLAWQAKGIPVLAESWTVGLGIGADLLLGVDALPMSPKGNRYQDVRMATEAAPIAVISGLADAGTPGLSELFRSRQAKRLQRHRPAMRRFSYIPDFSQSASLIMLGSKPSGLPPGLALHAEMRALAAAGLRGDQVLRAAGHNPASVLGLEQQIGRIAEGALADLVLVSGDPIQRVADAMNIVAVVRNGRFYSLVSLLERADDGSHVELFDKPTR